MALQPESNLVAEQTDHPVVLADTVPVPESIALMVSNVLEKEVEVGTVGPLESKAIEKSGERDAPKLFASEKFYEQRTKPTLALVTITSLSPVISGSMAGPPKAGSMGMSPPPANGEPYS